MTRTALRVQDETTRSAKPGDTFTTSCRACGRGLRMIFSDDGWKACQPMAVTGHVSLPRRPATLVTADGDAVNALVDQEAPRHLQGFELHYPHCRGWR